MRNSGTYAHKVSGGNTEFSSQVSLLSRKARANIGQRAIQAKLSIRKANLVSGATESAASRLSAIINLSLTFRYRVLAYM